MAGEQTPHPADRAFPAAGTAAGTSDPRPARLSARDRLERLVLASRAALFWDRLWPALMPALGVAALYVIVSLAGLWLALPPIGRMLGAGLFVVMALAALVPLARLGWPDRAQALARLDRGASHRPATTSDDNLALGLSDPASVNLWQAHRRRAERAIMALRAPVPQPGMTRRDPYALRLLGLVGVVAALFVAGPDWRARLTGAFDWKAPAAAEAAYRIDGWIDPPHYTRLAPIMLELTPAPDGTTRLAQVRAPVNSTLVLRVSGRQDVNLSLSGDLKEVKSEDTEAGKADTTRAEAAKPAAPTRIGAVEVTQTRHVVAGNGRVVVRATGVSRADVTINVIPDEPPQVSFASPPQPGQQPGTLSLSYVAKDDYGIAALEPVFESVEEAARTRALIPPPKPVLSLPLDPQAGGETRSDVDIANHAWAGARVRLTLVARDEAGQEARSETVSVDLPQRTFTKPLARALVEQRRLLAMDRQARKPVQFALDALRIAPDRFMPRLGEYLGVSVAGERLRLARSDADLIAVVDLLWEIAVRIEDGDLTEAERELRAAQEALREALDRNATPDEVRRLTEQLRQAMDRFLREFAEREMRNQRDDNQAQNQPNQRNQAQRFVTPEDLNRMLNRMEELYRQGDNEQAQRLLEQLRNMLNNLQTARPNRQRNQQGQEMEQALNDLEEMTRDQQELRDETFRQDGQQRRDRMRPNERQRGQQQQGQRGQRGQQGQQGQQGEQGDEQAEGGDQQGQGQGLAERQQRLRERLEALRRRMQERGMDPGQGLGDAEQAMRDAEQGLGQGDGQGAVDAQGRALEGLRQGQQNLAQQMQQQGEGEGEGQAGEPGDDPGQPGRASNNGQERQDPLGRPTRNPRANDNARFDRQGGRGSMELKIDDVIRELRRRLGDPSRPREELDYFERLLRPR
jgi:uncharacterized protein (TIGR02302 family)